MPFFTRPNFEDRQIVQRNGDTISLSGETNIDTSGQLIIRGVTLDFTGTTTASTLYTVAGLSGYINQGNVSSLKFQPPILLISGSTGTTTVDVTGYYLGGLDSSGNITWVIPSTGGTSTNVQFTGNTSGDCITDLYVKNLNSCSPLRIQNISSGDVLIGENGGVNVGIGTNTPNYKLHVSGNTKITGGLNIGTIGSGSPLINLGLDSNGNVVTGSIGTGGSGTFTGGTGSCITDLYVTNIHGCSPITVHDILSGNSGGAYINLNTDLTFTYTPLQLGIGDPIIGSYISFGSQNILLNTPNNTILTNNGNNSYYSLYDYGISLSSVPGGSMTASTIILTTTNSTNFGSPLTGGSQQGEIVFGIPNLDTGLPLGVMGTGLGSQTVPYGTPGVDYNPVFISTPRSRAYDNTSYSSIKNVLFGGGSDNSVYSGVTNSALIGGSYNSIVKSSDVSILGGTGNTINSSPFSSILAGQLNTIIGELNSTGTTNSSTIIGGTNNLISTQTPGYWNSLSILSGTGQANNSSIIGGENNSIYGHKNSIILGGENNLIHFEFPIFSNKNESIIGSSSCYVIGATNSFINSSSGSTIYYTNYSGVLGGTNNKIQQSDNSGILFGTNNSLAVSSSIATLTINSVIVGGSYNYVVPGTESSVIIGGNNITASTDNTVYVPDLIIKKSASIPTTSGDTVGEVGSITWDQNYLYVKTLSGWGRTLLDYSF